MAPMIDMVFLLLVFFMTVSTLAKDARPEMPLPESSVGAVPQEAPLREIISVFEADEGYRYFIGNRPVNADELLERFAPDSGFTRPGGVILRGSPELPWRAWEPVLAACRIAGLESLTFATFEQ